MSDFESTRGHWNHMQAHTGPVAAKGPTVSNNHWSGNQTTPNQGAGGGGITNSTSDEIHKYVKGTPQTQQEIIEKLKDANKKLRKELHTTQKGKILIAFDQLVQEWKHIEQEKNFEVGEGNAAHRKYIDYFLTIYMPRYLNTIERAKVQEKFYKWRKDQKYAYEDFNWDIEVEDADKTKLTQAQDDYRTATRTHNYQWWKKDSRIFFEPPKTFGNIENVDYTEDEKKQITEAHYKAYMATRENRRRAAWKQAVIKGTPPETGFITATPNPYVLDFAL